jgi:hypothetical protein
MTEKPDPMRIFGDLRPLDVRSLAGPVFEIDAPAGTELVREGEMIGTFFVVRSGHAEVTQRRERIRVLGPGDCFGESDPSSDAVQAHTIVAGSDMRLLAFSSLGIGRLCAAIPGTRERILAGLGGANGCAPNNGASGDPSAGDSAARPIAQGIRVEDGDAAVAGGNPAQLTHQPQRPRDGLARGAGPARQLVLSQR